MNAKNDGQEARSGNGILGWILVLVGFGYAVFAYYGLGPPPGGLPTHWWHPRTFMLDWPVVGGWVDNPGLGAIAVAVPAALICVAIFLTTRSAVARALGISFIVVSALFGGVGFAAGQAWEFFSWRMTMVAILSSLAIGCTIASPLLVKSWLRQSIAVRLLLYLPLFFAVMAAVRGATGTSEKLPLLVSPWPIFTAFGLEKGVVLITGVLFALALGVLSLSKSGRKDVLSYVGIAAGLMLPGAWLSWVLGGVGGSTFAVVTIVAAVAIGLAQLTFGGDRGAKLQARGLHLALGGALAFMPVFAGSALAKADKTVNRYLRAPRIIEALQSHIEKEESYPAKLDELVEQGYLDEDPVPRIGFAFLSALGLADEIHYRYNEYGSSFVLEFDSREWVQCAYSGNYYFDTREEEEEEVEIYGDVDDDEDEDYEETEYEQVDPWSCLGKQPNLFGDGAGAAAG